ncbi:MULTISPECIES: hypothetical protein [Amycolatopsis]|uniref:hypothetical protein n=1 Tax=Amycolatopsis TaxID=1813 RepID=UPI0012F8C8D6|nr:MULTISPECIES: hypothetical protein [Amycolatopsis]MCF6427601.1 hypothetical protein [Amycolatopsis tucumanensis]
MKVDSPPQPCSRCHRQVVLAGYSWGRQWVHLGTWRPQCGPPSWALARSAGTTSTAS